MDEVGAMVVIMVRGQRVVEGMVVGAAMVAIVVAVVGAVVSRLVIVVAVSANTVAEGVPPGDDS